MIPPPPHPRRLHAIAAATAALLVVLAPVDASAQRQSFVEQITALRWQLFGPYGDEGPRILEVLDQLPATLAAWDSDLADQSRSLAQIPTGSPERLADGRMAFAGRLARRGRYDEALQQVDAALVNAPAQGILYRFRGRLLEATGHGDEARTAYRRAWELDRHDALSAYLTLTVGPREVVETDPQVGPSAAPDAPILATLFDPQRRLVALTGSGPGPISELNAVPDAASATPLLAPAAYADAFQSIAGGHFREALARFRTAAARDPLIVDTTSRTEPMASGIARLRAGRMADAIAPLEAAAAMFPRSSEVHRILGTAYNAIGSDDKALDHLQRAVQLEPGDERARLALGRSLRDAGRLAEAANSLRETIAVLPRSAEARWMLAKVLEKTGQPIEAARLFNVVRFAPVLAGRGVLLWQVAASFDLHQDFDTVMSLLTDRARLRPNDPVVHKELGLVLSRLGRRSEAIVELAMADVLGGGDAETLTALGQAHLAAGRTADAEAALRRAIAIQADYQPARYALGRTLLRLGRASEAREQLEAFERIRASAMADQRRTFEVDRLRADASREAAAGHVAQAATIWQSIVERMPDVVEFRVAAADALSAAGNFQTAAAHLERAASMGDGPAVQYRLADVYARLGRRDASESARRQYEQQVRKLLEAPSAHRP